MGKQSVTRNSVTRNFHSISTLPLLLPQLSLFSISIILIIYIYIIIYINNRIQHPISLTVHNSSEATSEVELKIMSYTVTSYAFEEETTYPIRLRKMT